MIEPEGRMLDVGAVIDRRGLGPQKISVIRMCAATLILDALAQVLDR
jgi:hypothetical protein